MKIGIVNDHHGVELKQRLTKYLLEKGYDVVNCGTDTSESVDYPTYTFELGEGIRDGKIDRGILICMTGTGVTIACNKVKKVRCAKVYNVEEAYLCRNHNNANAISITSNLDYDLILKIIDTFLETPFSNEERHIRRNEMIDNYGS